MPIDEDILNQKVLDITSKLNENSLERETLRNLQTNAVSIQLVPDNVDKTKMIIPTDPKLGTTITEERRQEIYDKVIADVALL